MKQSVFAVVVIACLPAAASAQWTPVWTAAATHPQPPPVRMSAINLRVADDGTVFAGVDSTYQNSAHAGAIRVDHDGAFAWLSEREGTTWIAAGIERLASGRIAILGESSIGTSRTVFVRVVDGTTGKLAWQHESASGRPWIGEGDIRHLAEGPDGELRVRLTDGGDFVVLRLAADGTPLPAWRAPTGFAMARADEIAATADGGALVTGAAGIGEGFVTVRFDAQGEVVYTDVEPGEIGNPLGLARVRVTADDAAVVVASPETMGGVPGAMAWKIDPEGERLWTAELSDQSTFLTTFANGPIVLAADGDIIVAVEDVIDQRMRAIRLAGSDGGIVRRYEAKVEVTRVLSLALAPSGRLLLGGYDHIPGSGGQVASRLVEFDAGGQPCRSVVDTEPGSTHAVEWGPQGWYVLRADGALRVRHYDADGSCDLADLVFADGFEAIAR